MRVIHSIIWLVMVVWVISLLGVYTVQFRTPDFTAFQQIALAGDTGVGILSGFTIAFGVNAALGWPKAVRSVPSQSATRP